MRTLSALLALAIVLTLAGLAVTPGYARRPAPARGSAVRASFYDAPTRSSFASRRKDWRGKTFAITYRGRTVHAVCRDYGPQRHTGRDIDVSRDVAQRLGFVRKGVATVHIRRVR